MVWSLILWLALLYFAIKRFYRWLNRRAHDPSTRAGAGDETVHDLEQAIGRLTGHHPAAKFVMERVRAPLAIKDLLLGSAFGLVGFGLTVMTLVIAFKDLGRGSFDIGIVVILGAFSAMLLYLAASYFSAGWAFFRKDLGDPKAAADTPHHAATHRSQPPPQHTKKGERQFEEL